MYLGEFFIIPYGGIRLTKIPEVRTKMAGDKAGKSTKGKMETPPKVIKKPRPNGTKWLEGHSRSIKHGGRETLRGSVWAIMQRKKSMELESLIAAAIKRQKPKSKRPEYVYGCVVNGFITDGVMEKTQVNDDTVVVLK